VILRTFWIDLRGLTVLRILVALIVLADLFDRAPGLNSLYTDASVLPRSAIVPWLPSVYWWAQDFGQVAALFALTAVCGLWLLLGCKSAKAPSPCAAPAITTRPRRRRRHRADPRAAVLRRAPGRAGIAEGYEHRCRKPGCGHVELANDSASRRCPQDNRALWPRPLPKKRRRLAFAAARGHRNDARDLYAL